ncbi:MAG TPA: CocE/NonD family hydrolase [Candidatus Hydrogenedentes bacterium]|nr:CocE/NonD family hydrolase [Candidatus Hydrogenedentota bacterium]
MFRVRNLLALILSIILVSTIAGAVDTYSVAMSDGVTLVTDVYKPTTGGPAWPVILERTPYVRSNNLSSSWNGEGYVYIIQSVRGRYGSGGAFAPFADEGWGPSHTDGVDTVNWIKQQTWCNGKVATYGGSATACTGNLLGAATQSLKFQIAQEGASKWDDHLAYQGGVFLKALVEGWLTISVTTPEYANVWKAQPPSSTSYWRYYDAEARSAQVNSPGLHVGGWWDIFARATVDNFMARQYHGGPGALGNQKLLMRPTGHGPWGNQELQMASNYQQIGVTAYRKRFAKYWFGVSNDGIMKEPAVTYYVVGDDTNFGGPGWEWRTANHWPPFPPLTATYYLTQAGDLSPAPPAGATDKRTFAYDPANPVPTKGGQNLTLEYGPYDQRAVSNRADVLKFKTAPLSAPLETTGPFKVKLYVSSDAPDTDFTAKLVDIYPDGNPREILMLDSIQRVKYRNGYANPAPPLNPSDVAEVTIDLGHISWIFNTGHRIGVQISSSNYTRFEVNPNNGQELPGQGLPSRVANNTVHTSSAYPSALIVPVRNAAADADGDGLTDEREYDLGTDMDKADTDGDGRTDYAEVNAGSDPLDAQSYPGHVIYNVMNYGAVGNGTSDETASFTSAMAAVAAAGGGILKIPTGQYLLQPITVPSGVTLQGVWVAPNRGDSSDAGTTLLTTAGQGNAAGAPLLTLQTNSGLDGINVFYPTQVKTNPSIPFPWTIRGAGDRILLRNLTLINPYQAVDLGTNAGNGHRIEGLYAQALYRGLYLDQCLNPHLENIHFWPFFDLTNSGSWTFTRANGIAFQFGKVQGVTALNLFSIFYKITFQYADYGYGPGGGVYVNMYPDVTQKAFDIQKVDPATGLTIRNGLIFSGVDVGAANTGAVTFAASGFMGSNNLSANGFVTTYHANLLGTGPVTFDACHFSGWDEGATKGVHCIIANCASVAITGCEFGDGRGDRKDIQLGANVQNAEIVGNRAQNGFQWTNNAPPGANVVVQYNTGLK